MDNFGPRAGMLEVLDRLVAISSSHFRAAEAGQLSLFGAATGVTENISLPLVPNADRRETLAWERELIGMYMSEHPLTPYLNEIRRVVTHFSSNLGEAAHEEKTRVAGMVSGIRPHQTKTGRMMAWVTLEDLTGIIELVVFPRTWEKYQFALEVGGVIVAEGKVDAQSSPSKVLVDNIRTEIKLTEPVSGGTPQPAQMPLQPQRRSSSVENGNARSMPQGQTAGIKDVSEPSTPSRDYVPESDDLDWDSMPPLPEAPPEWETYTPARTTFSEPDLVVHEPDLPEEEQTSAEDRETTKSSPSTAVIPPSPDVEHQSSIEAPAVVLTPKLPPAPASTRLEEEHAPQMVTIILRPSGDPLRDIRRISRLHGTFISYPGKDRFAFQIFEEGRGHLIEFPNDTTHLCAELTAMLKEAVGEENLRIEPILYQ
jgi:DNA polymerase-3 subunit alpha